MPKDIQLELTPKDASDKKLILPVAAKKLKGLRKRHQGYSNSSKID
ncbi:MAG: hypothetical protein HC906_17750 [Bacteroidales bacterium]|nr:hypothetical protein [Bacteroidales bacterium]